MKQVWLSGEHVIEYHKNDDMKEEVIKKKMSVPEIELMLQDRLKDFDQILVYNFVNDLVLGYVKGKKTHFPTNFATPEMDDRFNNDIEYIEED